jgi:hypothetical protein
MVYIYFQDQYILKKMIKVILIEAKNVILSYNYSIFLIKIHFRF